MRSCDWSSDVCSSDLLCRGFLKGRDWYDFSWYVAKGTAPNLPLLRAALIQAGPWAGDESIAVNMPWLKDALGSTIAGLDWKAAAEDVRRFLRPAELKSIDLWSERRSEEHTSELRSLMLTSYAVFCLK